MDSKTFHNTHWTIDADTLAIIWQNFPRDTIYDIYPLLNRMELENDPLLMVIVDGLGSNMLENANAHERAGYFENMLLSPMRTVYPPRTRYALYVVGNGVHLNQTSGVRNRDLFSQLGITSAYIIENDRVFFTSQFPIVLNAQTNNNGTIDDEIYASAVQHLTKEFELLVVHFHSIDEAAHDFGPYSQQTMAQIEIVSGFVHGLRTQWDGRMIVLSDHGLHSSGLQGNHGINRIEDMVAVVSYEV